MYLTRKNDSNIYLINCNDEKTCFREEKEKTPGRNRTLYPSRARRALFH